MSPYLEDNMIINADELYIYIKDASMEISDEKELGEKR
jgi:uncharacterized protein YuzE